MHFIVHSDVHFGMDFGVQLDGNLECDEVNRQFVSVKFELKSIRHNQNSTQIIIKREMGFKFYLHDIVILVSGNELNLNITFLQSGAHRTGPRKVKFSIGPGKVHFPESKFIIKLLKRIGNNYDWTGCYSPC